MWSTRHVRVQLIIMQTSNGGLLYARQCQNETTCKTNNYKSVKIRNMNEFLNDIFLVYVIYKLLMISCTTINAPVMALFVTLKLSGSDCLSTDSTTRLAAI